MPWNFGIPGQVRRVASGIGSVLGKQFDLKAEIDRCHAKLSKSTAFLEVLASPGWAEACKEYEHLVAMQRETINILTQNAEKNADEIQIRRNLQFACELWLQAMQAKKVDHDETVVRLNHYKKKAAQTVGLTS